MFALFPPPPWWDCKWVALEAWKCVSLQLVRRKSLPLSINRSSAGLQVRLPESVAGLLWTPVVSRTTDLDSKPGTVPAPWALTASLQGQTSVVLPECVGSQGSLCWVINKSCELATLPIPWNCSCMCSYPVVNAKVCVSKLTPAFLPWESICLCAWCVYLVYA